LLSWLPETIALIIQLQHLDHSLRAEAVADSHHEQHRVERPGFIPIDDAQIRARVQDFCDERILVLTFQEIEEQMSV